jgi:hypothetical protein
VLAAFADAKPTKETHMKRQLKQTGILAAGLFCATQALAGWTDVADEKELRAVQAGSTFQGQDIYGRGFSAAFEQDGTAAVSVGGASMTAPWHFARGEQLCIEWQEGTECYRVQRGEGSQYRTVRVRDGQEMPIFARQGESPKLSALGR